MRPDGSRHQLKTEKTSHAVVQPKESARTNVPAFAHSEMQGWRASMEDATVAALLNHAGTSQLFALFDGHGGDFASKWAAKEAPKRVTEMLLNHTSQDDPQNRLKLDQVLLAMDSDLRAHACTWGCGTTAVLLVVTPYHLTVANLGDSRAVLYRSGEVVAMTQDHKPTDGEERSRIVRAGGFVVDARVNGDLALSRALGDFRHKAVRGLPPHKQPVSSLADIFYGVRQPNDSFILIACDGVWDVMGSAEAAEYCAASFESIPLHEETATGYEDQRSGLVRVCERLLDECIRRGSTDNVSAILILLDPNLRPRDIPRHRSAMCKLKDVCSDCLCINIDPSSGSEPVLDRWFNRATRASRRTLCSRAALITFFFCALLVTTKYYSPVLSAELSDPRQPILVRPIRPYSSMDRRSGLLNGDVADIDLSTETGGATIVHVK